MELEWLKEEVDRFPMNGFIYRLMCFLVRRKLTYQEIYAIMVNLNIKKNPVNAKELSLNKIIELYKYNHNNKLPKELTDDD